MIYKDNQPTFNVGNRKVVNFKDYLQNKDAEKAKLTKADLQSKPNSEDQQHLGNKRTEYNQVTHKLTDYSVDEIEDTLDSMDKLEESLSNEYKELVKSSKNSFKIEGPVGSRKSSPTINISLEDDDEIRFFIDGTFESDSLYIDQKELKQLIKFLQSKIK